MVQHGYFEAGIYILGWYLFSLSISIYNKWMFGDGLDFKFPILITSFHQFCLMILSGLVLYMKPSLRANKMSFASLFDIDKMVYLKQIIPCSIVSAGDIGFSNISYKFISLSLYTMLKTSSLMFVLIFGLIFKLETFNWRLIVIVLIMSASVVMMVSKPNGESLKNSKNESMGIIFVLLASLISGIRWSLTQILLKRNHNPYTTNSINTIFYLSPLMCLVLLILGLIFEGWSNFINHDIWDIKGTFYTLILLIIPGFLAFMMTVCEFKLLHVAQIITLSIAGIFKELLTIVFSTIIFGDRLSWLNILGLIITLADILWYNIYRHLHNTKSEKYQQLNQSDDNQLDEFIVSDSMELEPVSPRSRKGLVNSNLL